MEEYEVFSFWCFYCNHKFRSWMMKMRGNNEELSKGDRPWYRGEDDGENGCATTSDVRVNFYTRREDVWSRHAHSIDNNAVGESNDVGNNKKIAKEIMRVERSTIIDFALNIMRLMWRTIGLFTSKITKMLWLIITTIVVQREFIGIMHERRVHIRKFKRPIG